MKFIRNSRVRDRVIDAVAKGILIAFSALVCLWMVSGARAAGGTDISAIQQHANADGSYDVEFLLSKNVAKEDVAVEFQRNFIQLSLKNVSAYPARTQKLEHSMMEKVFTYQYQPDMARARLLLKSDASAIQGMSSWEIDNKIVRITVKAGKPTVTAKHTDAVKTRSSAGAAGESANSDEEEQKLRDHIVATGSAKSDAVTAAAPGIAATSTKKVDFESAPIFSAATEAGTAPEVKSKDSTATKVFASLLLVVGLIGAGSLAFRRFVLGRGNSLQRQGRMIEVLATQTMGPKRSIAVIKVLDQTMVVGMSGDGMSLLTNLGSNVNTDKFADDFTIGGGGASFTDTLKSTMSISPAASSDAAPASNAKRSQSNLGFRASLKQRLEGFKPL